MNKNKQVVLITGASGGIGAAAAIAFDKEDYNVAIAARNKDKLNKLAKKLKNPLVLVTDLSIINDAIKMVDMVVDNFGKIDLLINNAASIIVSPAEQVKPEDLTYAFNVNLTSAVVATQQAVKHMKSQGKGHIINIGSPGYMMGIPFYSPYVCSKAAFSAWTRTIQAEWADSEIKVSEYFPGYIKTDSIPVSRIGRVEQDFLMTDKPNFMQRIFTAPRSPEYMAKHLVKLAKHPRTIMYSGLSVKIGAFISNFPGFRLSLASNMAENGRKKLKTKN